MKNYIPLYIIIAMLTVIFVCGYAEMGAVQRQLLEPAIVMRDKISTGEDVSADYNQLLRSFEKHEVWLNIFVNHSVYDAAVQCMSKIGNDIKYNSVAALEADTDRLILCLNGIVESEKIKINNIF